MIRSFKYRLYPTKAQITAINTVINVCRWLWNRNLNERIETYKNDGKSLSAFDQNNSLKSLKKEYPWLSSVHAQVLQNVNHRLHLAYQAFFRRIKLGENPGHPRFKSRDTRGSFTYTQSGFHVDENRVFLSKIGYVKFIRHRDMPDNIKQCTVKRCHDEYYIIFICEVDNIVEFREIKTIVGLDLGIENFATLSDKIVIPNPRISRKQVAKCQRRYSKTKTVKTRRALQKAYKRLVNRREDFTHKLSKSLVDKYDCIVVEDLNIDKMITSETTNRNLNREVMDASWNSFTHKLEYKAESAGKRVVKVNPAYTSQRCSRCSEIVTKSLSERVHVCSCGLSIHRDLNAALNIKTLGLESLTLKRLDAPT